MDSTKTPAEIESEICDTIATFGPDREAVVRDANLEQLDVDSLDMVELAQIIESDLGVRVEFADFKGAVTVGEAIDVVIAKAQAGATA
jgi:acyl carrier protein